MNFTEIPDKLKYPPKHRGQLSTMHSAIVVYCTKNFDKSQKTRQSILDAMNSVSYIILSGDHIPSSWSEATPLSIDKIPEDICKPVIGDLFLHDRRITWDLQISTDNEEVQTVTVEKSTVIPVQNTQKRAVVTEKLTPKEDLYLKPPTVPQFDTKKIWASSYIGADHLVIYKSLPEIPSKQNEISTTTDVESLTHSDLMKLYPNHFIQTRSSVMYKQIPGMSYHDDLGLVIPIQGFTEEQVIDNIVKYPHFFKLLKSVGGKLESFYSTIEIDGDLYKTLDVWDDLPESKIIPRSSEFIKEYIVRRYLLERDLQHIDHRYKLYGTLDEFLTLFTTPDDYIRLGYTDTYELARRCVQARVSYKRSRNPVLRRIENA